MTVKADELKDNELEEPIEEIVYQFVIALGLVEPKPICEFTLYFVLSSYVKLSLKNYPVDVYCFSFMECRDFCTIGFKMKLTQFSPVQF